MCKARVEKSIRNYLLCRNWIHFRSFYCMVPMCALLHYIYKHSFHKSIYICKPAVIHFGSHKWFVLSHSNLLIRSLANTSHVVFARKFNLPLRKWEIAIFIHFVYVSMPVYNYTVLFILLATFVERLNPYNIFHPRLDNDNNIVTILHQIWQNTIYEQCKI